MPIEIRSKKCIGLMLILLTGFASPLFAEKKESLTAVPPFRFNFPHQPIVTPLASDDENSDTPWDSSGQVDYEKNKDALVYEFWDPAEFYLTRYGPDEVAHDDPALSIFEGMRIVFHRTGKYEIRFTTSATQRPVSIQLQFGLAKKSDGSGYRTLMTIPKIQIPFSVKSDDQKIAPSNVLHVGYSPNVADCYHILKAISDKRCSSCPRNKSEWTIQRHGKAKFGFGAAAL